MRVQTRQFCSNLLQTLCVVICLFLAGCEDKSLDHWNRGNAYFFAGEYDRAISEFNKAIEINPTYVEAYGNRGLAYLEKGEHDRAISDFNKAIEINPWDDKATVNRGIAYGAKGEYDLAISDFNKAIEINPWDAKAYFNRGSAFYQEDEYDLAISDYDKAIEIDPMYPKAFFSRGRAFYKKGEYDKALDDIHKAQMLGGQVPSELLNLLREATRRQKMKEIGLDPSPFTEKDFIETLRIWSEIIRDDTFPEDVNRENGVKALPVLGQKLDQMQVSEQERTEIARKFARGMTFLHVHILDTDSVDWNYAGAGVKLGDAATAIFWYRPQGSQTYRVIYGDLNVKDVPESDLPK